MFELKLENINGNIVNLDDGIKYIVSDVTGLNPPSASIFTSKSPNRKGVKFNGSSVDARSIIITIKLLGNIVENRNALYEWIDTEQYVKIHYRNEVKNVYCEGHIEECDIPTFTDSETISLAILCEDPYWKELEEISVSISGILKQFTFPFAISNSIPFSTIKDTNTTTIFNNGAETGFKIIIKCSGEVTNLAVFNPNDITQRFQINTTIPTNSIVEIDSDSSPKTVKLYKADGSVENLLKYTGVNTTWFVLKRGANIFGYSADAGVSNMEISVNFQNKFLGV